MKSKFLSSAIKTVNNKQNKISRSRLIVGGLMLIFWFYPVLFSAGMAALYPSSLLLIIGFIFLVYQSARLKEFKAYLVQRDKLEDRREFQRQADFKYTSEEINRWTLLVTKMKLDKSAHWDDLDLIKAHGLLQAMHSTGNAESLQFLINLMRRNSLNSEQILQRQAQVRLLAQGPRRKALTLLTLNPESASVGSGNNTVQVLLQEPLVKNTLWVYLIYGYYLALWLSYGLYLSSGLTFFGILLMGLFFIFPLANSQVKIFKALSWVSGFEAQLTRLQKVKKIIQYYSQQGADKNIPLLSSYLDSKKGVAFEAALKELNRIIGAMGLRQNVILYGIVHAVLPWDFYWTARTDVLRRKLENIYTHWIEDLIAFEAYALLAEYSENTASGVWPTIVPQAAVLTAKSLRHPLIPSRHMVANDVNLNPTDKKCLLITGSNMSGKSTFLRTLGINLILMRIGCKVHASQFDSAPFQVLTSLKRVDSLEESLSTFYSEVKNLKEIKDECNFSLSLYLIDEIFRGTNNRERLIGAQKYIKALLQSPSVGLVTTHDLELSQLEQEYKNLVNEHFADSILDGKMTFDYLKKQGPCPSTNALKVMEMEGVF